MNKRVLLLVLLLLPCPSQAKPASSTGEFQIPDVATYSYPDEPMVTLVKAVDAHPQRQRFHLWWGFAGTHGYSYNGELIYSKNRRTLWIKFSHQEESEDVAGTGYSDTSIWSQVWRFRGVTPQRLRALNKRYVGKRFTDDDVPDTASDVSFFPQLTEFGCRGGLVKRTFARRRQKI